MQELAVALSVIVAQGDLLGVFDTNGTLGVAHATEGVVLDDNVAVELDGGIVGGLETDADAGTLAVRGEVAMVEVIAADDGVLGVPTFLPSGLAAENDGVMLTPRKVLFSMRTL